MKKLLLVIGIIVLLLLVACSVEKNQPQISLDQTDIPTSIQKTKVPVNNNSADRPTEGTLNSDKHEQDRIYEGEEYEIQAQQSSVSQPSTGNVLSMPSSSMTAPSTSVMTTPKPIPSAVPSQQTQIEQENKGEEKNTVHQSNIGINEPEINYQTPAYGGEEYKIPGQQSSPVPQTQENNVPAALESSTNVTSTPEPAASELPSQQTPTPETTPVIPAQQIPVPEYTGSLAGEEDTDF